jgi:hypothetical protein
MSPIKAMKIIWEVESKFDVAVLEYKDLKLWPIMRFPLYCEFNSNRVAVRPTTRPEKLKHFLERLSPRARIRILTEATIDRQHRASPSQSDVMYLTHSTSRTSKLEGGGFDAFFSPLMLHLRELGIQSFGQELAPRGQYIVPRFEPTQFIERFSQKFEMLSRFGPEATIPEQTLNGLREIGEYVFENYGLRPKALEPRRVSKSVRRLEYWTKHFETVLDVVSPKLVMVVNYYSPPGHALTHAANRRGITTVDIQHGIQGDFHPAYSFLPNDPDGPWSVVPKLFWTWSEQDAQNINRWGNYFHQGISGGNPLTEFSLTVGTHNEQTETLRRRINGSGRAHVVLVAYDGFYHEQWTEVVRDLIQQDVLSNVYWLIRVHPGRRYMMRSIKKLFDSTYVDVTISTESNLIDVLGLSDLVLAHSSTLAIEAADFGLPVVLDSSTEPRFRQFNDSGHLNFAETSSAEALSRNLRKVLGAVSKESTGEAVLPSKPGEMGLALRHLLSIANIST